MLMWAAKHGVSDLACKLAVLLEESSAKSREVDLDVVLQQSVPKHLKHRIAQLKKWVNERNCGAIDKAQSSLRTSDSFPSLGVLLAQAYPDWIAQRRSGEDARFILCCGAGAFVKDDDPLAHESWLAVAKMGGAAQQAQVFLACALNINELFDWAPSLFSNAKKLEWDDRRERVIAEQQQRLGALVINSKAMTDVESPVYLGLMNVGSGKRVCN